MKKTRITWFSCIPLLRVVDGVKYNTNTLAKGSHQGDFCRNPIYSFRYLSPNGLSPKSNNAALIPRMSQSECAR